MVSAPKPHSSTPASLRLALGLLSSYLFFLLRRPISGSNVHYLEQRLRGFRSLVPLIETGDTPPLRAIARSLRRLQVANFVQTARDLQFRLLPLVSDASVPPDFIVSVDRPSISPFEGAGKIVIITGPRTLARRSRLYPAMPGYGRAWRVCAMFFITAPTASC